ncbi:hypothetical protein D9M68_586550 [compost metagenome]
MRTEESAAERAPGDHFFDAIWRKQNAGNVSVILDERVLAGLASHLAANLQRELSGSNISPLLQTCSEREHQSLQLDVSSLKRVELGQALIRERQRDQLVHSAGRQQQLRQRRRHIRAGRRERPQL